MPVQGTCQRCGLPFTKRSGHANRYCSKTCYWTHRATVYADARADLFWARVASGAADACWPWQRSRTTHGHGQANWAGRTTSAHRVAWELTHGPIPAGLWVCHRCDNPPCCNPAHLFLGTPVDNGVDMVRKGRDRPPRGERSAQARLSAADVREIRRRVAAGEQQKALAVAFGVAASTITNMLAGRTWAHVI